MRRRHTLLIIYFFIFVCQQAPQELRSFVQCSVSHECNVCVWFSISLSSTSRNGRSSALLIGSERERPSWRSDWDEQRWCPANTRQPLNVFSGTERPLRCRPFLLSFLYVRFPLNRKINSYLREQHCQSSRCFIYFHHKYGNVPECLKNEILCFTFIILFLDKKYNKCICCKLYISLFTENFLYA